MIVKMWKNSFGLTKPKLQQISYIIVEVKLRQISYGLLRKNYDKLVMNERKVMKN